MASLASSYVKLRKNYSKIKPLMQLPYLIELQKNSYSSFLQSNTDPEKRQEIGLQSVFKSVFPIDDFSGKLSISFSKYFFEKSKYTVNECRQKSLTYAAPLKIVVQLIVWEKSAEGNKSIKEVKEQEVYFGEIPLMTDNGTFVINGIERVVVTQLHRSSGVFFDHDKGKNSATGKLLYSARIIPHRGSWLDFEFDHKDILYVRIDRRRKIYVTILLKAIGYSDEELLNLFYKKDVIHIEDGIFKKKIDYDLIRGQYSVKDIVDQKGNIIIKKGRRFTQLSINKLKKASVDHIILDEQDLLSLISAKNIYNLSGEMIVPINEYITKPHLEKILESNISSIEVLNIDDVNSDATFSNILRQDGVSNKSEALLEIYKRLRPGEPPTVEAAQNLFSGLFFDPDRYDLGSVGRIKLNERLSLNIDENVKVLENEDIVKTVGYLLKLKMGNGYTDDIDHLGNRRIRAVGELLENQYRIGLIRVERAVKEKLQFSDVDSNLPHDFINNKPAAAVIREFFGTSQLSQFMDQTNPLSEITHKRRLSSLGPGGLNRERAGFEVRDVHPTHYGRICPIETPEGPNIGLISSLAGYARVNKFGFIETPYKNVKSLDVKYYSATKENEAHVISQARVDLPENPNELVVARKSGEIETVQTQEIDLMDVSPQQLVSVASSLIPFLQNDDANRALMGSNMMRQAVPLLKAQAPIVGTGMEYPVARDSGASLVARRSGIVEYVDSKSIVVKVKSEDNNNDEHDVGTDVDVYNLLKYKRSNIDTCINHKTLVNVGESITKGDIIADGFATDMGELALGSNVIVAFMPWNGYNFEDSILVSERMVKQDSFTSIHIQEFECVARDTKLGPEEITCDIPSISEEMLSNLDESGIVRIGAEVGPNDLLVGKITPKGETQLTPEEKLLKAIFGEKASDVRDSSLRVPTGVFGTVISAQVFSREGVDKGERALEIENEEISRLKKDENLKIQIIKQSAKNKIFKIVHNKEICRDIFDRNANVVLKNGSVIKNLEIFDKINYLMWSQIRLSSLKQNQDIKKIISSFNKEIDLIKTNTNNQIDNIKKSDQLLPGVIKMVKIYLAIKRKLSVGDKMAGRHGNKGVVSRILPEEDMPFLKDGTPVDFVLNPLGVPSRMNVGQILEVHLGGAMMGIGKKLNQMLENSVPRDDLENFILNIWNEDNIKNEVKEFVKNASYKQLSDFIKKYKNGVTVANPVFDGANEKEIQDALRLSDSNIDGKVDLYDGKTGDKFKERVTVGVMYVLKLHHLVDEKIHARSIGPYSLVTQQPLGGKAQFGGQRLGEMEVWAMEAYGAAYTLQEFLTVKADDVLGRTRMYEYIVKGRHDITPGIPESFNVLVKELQSLGLNIDLIKKPEKTVDINENDEIQDS
jgi:DNA-directed RNA polymerase subunit beta